MARKKSPNTEEEKNTGAEKKSSPKKLTETDPELSELVEDFNILGDEDELAEDDDFGEEIDEEDEEKEVLKHLKDYDKKHRELKIISVYDKIGSPKFKPCDKIKDPSEIEEQYKKFLGLLDEHNIIVHFKNDYTAKEKYRFVTEEVFKQDVEDFNKSKIHINFIYEDFHPEMDEDEDDEDYY